MAQRPADIPQHEITGGHLPRSIVAAPAARGLNRVEAARYVGVSPNKFDELVRGGLMPRPKEVGARRIWDRHALDIAFDQLPSHDSEGENPWDD